MNLRLVKSFQEDIHWWDWLLFRFKYNWHHWFQEQLVQENAARQAVTQALQKKMEDDKRDLTQTMVKGTEELKQKLEEDKKELVEKLDGETGLIKARIETVKDETKNEQKRLETEMTKGKESLAERLRRENEEIQARMKRDAEERAKRETEMKAGDFMILARNFHTRVCNPFEDCQTLKLAFFYEKSPK